MGTHAHAELFFGVILGNNDDGYPIRPPTWAGEAYSEWIYGQDDEIIDGEDLDDDNEDNLGEWEEYLSDDARRESPCEITSFGTEDYQTYAAVIKAVHKRSDSYGYFRVEDIGVDPRWPGQIRAFLEKIGYRAEDLHDIETGWFVASDYG